MPEFRFPWMLAVGAAAVAGVALLVALRGGTRSVPVGALVAGRDAGSGPGRGALVLDRVPGFLRAGAVLLLVLATGAPFRPEAGGVPPPSGVVVMLVLDVSPSMADGFPGGGSKLDVARRETLRFLEGRGGDAVGLVTFGGEAAVRVPPSLERGALLAALADVEPGAMGDGTALGTALGLAADRMRGLGSPSRVVLLLTDGEGNAGALDPVRAARAAGALGQRVHVVDVSGQEDSARLLGRVAHAGGGEHLMVSDARALDDAYREVASLEPGPLDGVAGRAGGLPLATPALALALALLAGERALRASRWGSLP